MADCPVHLQIQSWQEDLARALGEARRFCPGEPAGTKTVYIVRHAESVGNVATMRLRAGDRMAVVQWLHAGQDSPLSPEGLRQLASMRPAARRLGDEVEAVLYSPLQRARRTALELFGDEDKQGGFRPRQGQFWRSVAALKEKRPRELLQDKLLGSRSILDERVQGFLGFLKALPWTRVALVGHGLFFKAMLARMGAHTRLSNADIIRTVVTVSHRSLECGPLQVVARPTQTSGIAATADAKDAGTDEELRVQRTCV